MINGLSVVKRAGWIATNQSSPTDLRSYSSLHALSLDHFEGLIFSHLKSSTRRNSRTDRITSYFWTHIRWHPIWTMDSWRVHSKVIWTLRHATNLVLGLIEDREHVSVGGTHLDQVLVGSLDLLRWAIEWLILGLEIVKLQLLLLLVKPHLLPWSLPVSFVLGHNLIWGRHLIATELLCVVMGGLDSSFRLAGVVGTERWRSLFLLLVHL